MNDKALPEHLIRGRQAEQVAYDYLVAQGLQSVNKNFNCRYGELDLIMRDQQTLVIVEVRFRKSNKFGGAVESITQKKQSSIIAATQYYCVQHKINSPIRFDVVALSSDKEINWIKNAFSH